MQNKYEKEKISFIFWVLNAGLSLCSCVHHDAMDAYVRGYILASRQYKVNIIQCRVNLTQRDFQVA
jgi:hypothetical protein